jgi:ubiquinone/menaquinone biosynthesis C-methylase UbiE
LPIEEGVEHWQRAYNEQPDVYEDFSRCAREGIVLRRLLERAQFSGKAVLEIGCGSGTQTRQLAPLSRKYLALDVSGPLLDLAKRKCGRLANLTLVYGAAERLPLTDGSVDAVFSGWLLDALWPFEVREAALAEVDRVLRRGGHVWVLANHPEKGEFMRMRGEKEIQAELSNYRFMLHHGFEHVDTIETSFGFPSLEEAKRILGFIFGERALRFLEANPRPELEHTVIVYHKSA